MARAKSKAEPTSATTSPTGDKPPAKKRRGRPPKSQPSSSAAKKTPTNGRKKRRVGRPPKSQAAKATKKATAKSSRKTSPKAATKKRVGRPPKTAAAKAKATRRTTTTAKKRVGRPRKTVADDDGRRIPVSATTTRALAAASRALDALKKERGALADAVDASTAARMKARSSGQKRDKTLAKKARQKVQRITEKVSVRRTAAREAKANVAKLKAQDLLNARMNNIEVRLRRAEEAATERVAAKLERQTEKFRATTLERLDKVEARKTKKRARKAESDRAALLRKFEATVRAADDALMPKERKKRRRRRAPSA